MIPGGCSDAPPVMEIAVHEAMVCGAVVDHRR